ncbi:protein fem-1 homolog A-like protein [Lates japonicus]|uniref:Protein fem-1 homolog A-like protein n=1 Tax=Lates japonicus TaxID=270547 RepID=A0AAD3MF37_LATJO|nr:protein fem-1 homolog A-like protein [Lates japonicus]
MSSIILHLIFLLEKLEAALSRSTRRSTRYCLLKLNLGSEQLHSSPHGCRQRNHIRVTIRWPLPPRRWQHCSSVGEQMWDSRDCENNTLHIAASNTSRLRHHGEGWAH